MKAIWKFKISGIGRNGMPEGAEILHVGLDPSNEVCLWAIVDTEAKVGDRRIEIVGTGQRLLATTGREHFLGTVRQGEFMWHIFDFGEPVYGEPAL